MGETGTVPAVPPLWAGKKYTKHKQKGEENR
jgi:hypothetical protein